MPANLTPEYLKAEESYKAARDPEEKLRYLEMMLSTIPKHKGTDKMQADIKRRISKTKDLLEKKSGAKRYNPFKVEREGVGQIAVVGAPNSGKSAVVGRLTNAKCQVADYPFTTTKPVPGMMAFENVQVQLVDLPPVSVEYTESIMVGMVRNTDGIVLVFDLASEDPLKDIEEVREVLLDHKLEIKGNPIKKFTPDGIAHLKAILVGNKLDVMGAAENLDLVKKLYSGEFSILGVSANNGSGLEDIRSEVFQMLDIIRVYTKSPGKKPDFSDPVTLKKGATVIDFASYIHKDFAKALKFARIWSKSANKYDGQKVNRDESLTDGDVIELHL
jgi:small GTP-binding protein